MLAAKRVRVAPPFFCKAPLEMTPLETTSESVWMMRGAPPPRSSVPFKVRTPLSEPLPSTVPALNTKLLARVRAVLPTAWRVPPLIVTEAEPKAASLPTRRMPAATVVPPE